MKELIHLPRLTLPEAMAKARLSLREFDTLVIDVRGSEMEILMGIFCLETQFT